MKLKKIGSLVFAASLALSAAAGLAGCSLAGNITSAYDNSSDWATIYKEYLLSTYFTENNNDLLSSDNIPTVSLLDLNFDGTPELIYYDGGMKWGGLGINKQCIVYGINGSNRVYEQDKITLQNVAECALCINNITNKQEYLTLSGASQWIGISTLYDVGIAISNRAGEALGVSEYRWFVDNVETYVSNSLNWPDDIEKITNYTVVGLSSSKEYEWENKYSYDKKKRIIDEMISAYSGTDSSENAISVVLNGGNVKFDQPPVIINDRTMVPIRAIFEAMGYTVDWNQSTQTASAIKGRDQIIVQIGSSTISYIVSGQSGTYYCDTVPQIVSGRTLVPIRAIAECAGCEVDWNGNTKTVSIEYSNYEHSSASSSMSSAEIENHVSAYIRPLYNDINNNLSNYEKHDANQAIAYYQNNKCVKKTFYSGANGYNRSREYYYDAETGELVFAFVFSGTTEYRLYFKDNQLIRYIGSDGVTIDNPTSAQALSLADFVLSEAY